MTDHEYELGKIESRLKSLETRLARLESVLVIPERENTDYSDEQAQPLEVSLNSERTDVEEKGLESQIGQFGLAWLGNIVLLFGIIFLTQYLMIQGFRFPSLILGYIAALSIFFLSTYLKKTNGPLSFMFKMNAQVLLYYLTLRLHFFSAAPIIVNNTIAVMLLLFLIAFQAYLSIRDKSQAFATLFVIFALTTGVVCDTAALILPLISLAAAGSVYYFYRFNWKPLLIVTIILCYILSFLWLLGNPIMGHPMKLIAEQNSGVICFFGLGAVFSAVLLFRSRDQSADDFLTGVTLVNGILYSLLLVFIVLGFFSKNYVGLFSALTICCLAYSIFLHSKYEWNFASAFYALYGFMAMSISFHGLLGFPRVYLLLAVQSLVVVSMALWFRNRLIAIMNSLLFLMIMITYLISSKSINNVNYSFALISLVSARIINWKKSRLHIETDLMRNLYLIEGFFIVLYALYHAVPKQFITLSWTIAALLYFLLSFVLKNVKYRYMALGTMICSAFYLFLVDLAHIELIYRVLALLFLAAISIGISIYYSNRVKK
ncbi:MAG TPA: hypothetical protein VF346_05355 [Bacteroidales bacterium]